MVIPKTGRGVKRYYWDLVLNNYTNNDCEVVKDIFDKNCTSYIIGKEIGSEKLTPHLQMCIKLKLGNYKSFILNLFKHTCVGNRISIREIRNIEATKNYCMKDANIYASKKIEDFIKVESKVAAQKRLALYIEKLREPGLAFEKELIKYYK